MNNRLLDLIKYKTGGRQNRFAELLGWTPQYLAKLLRGENFGLQPVLAILERLPEVNARWFLFGEGEMLNDDKMSDLRYEAFSRVQSIMMFDRYLSEMLHGNSCPDFSIHDITRWEVLLDKKQRAIDKKFNDAMSKSIELCKHPKVKQ